MKRAAPASSDLLPLIGLAALALAVRLLFLLGIPRVVDTPDAVQYIGIARSLAAGDWAGVDARIPILYPALCALAHLLIADVEWACRMVSLVCSTALPPLAFLLFRRLHDRRAALAAGVALACWPWLADYGSRIIPESLAVTLWFAGAFTLIRAGESGRAWTPLAAMLLFALHLTRPEGTFYLAAGPLFVVLAGMGVAPRKVLARRAGVFLLSVAVLVLAQLALSRILTGEAMLNARMADPGRSLFYTFIIRGRETARTALSLWGDVIPRMLGPYVLAMAGVGLATWGRHRLARGELVLGAMMLLQLGLAVLSTYPEPRYLMAPLAVALAVGCRGMTVAANHPVLRRFPAGPLLPHAVLLAFFTLGTALTIAPFWTGRLPESPVEYKLAGQWMRDNLEPGRILSRKPQVGFYAEMQTVGPDPEAGLDAILDQAHRQQVRYVVVDERYTAKLVPALAPLLDPDRAPEGLEPLRDDLSPWPDGRIVIYRLRKMVASP
jgi:4-amino-4-deoxy-L-arabinose transferase-like glycosyltransferase